MESQCTSICHHLRPDGTSRRQGFSLPDSRLHKDAEVQQQSYSSRNLEKEIPQKSLKSYQKSGAELKMKIPGGHPFLAGSEQSIPRTGEVGHLLHARSPTSCQEQEPGSYVQQLLIKLKAELPDFERSHMPLSSDTLRFRWMA